MRNHTAEANDATEQLIGSHYPVWDSWLPKLDHCGDWAKELSRWYESDWQQALQGGRHPVSDQVLESLDDAQRSVVKPVFDSMDAHYSSRLRHPSRPTLDAGDDATELLPATKIESPVVHAGHTGNPHELAEPRIEPTIPGSSALANAANPATMEFSAGFATNAPSTGKVVIRSKSEPHLAASAIPNIPGYRIEHVLGRGGMGVVYRAHQLGIDRPVALKMVLAGIHSSRTLLDRFLAEAKAVGRLRHENIVQIYDSGWHENLPYFSLEFVDGPALSQKLGGEPMDPVEAARLVAPLADALQYAHSQGIIHRDVKPGNVLLTPSGIPKLADFGLAKQQEDDSDLSRTGDVIGTPGYMAPEQARGQSDITGSVDIYGLGGVLYCALTGRPPFQAAKSVDTIIQLLEQEPVTPSRLQPGVPKDLETICLKCLQKTPAQRYATAGDLAADLTRFVNGEPIAARPVGRAERLYRWSRRKPRIAALVATATVSALLLMIGGPILAGVIYAKKQEVEQAKLEADTNAQLAKRSAAEAIANAQLAERNEQEALTQEKNAIDALTSMVYETQRRLTDKPGLQDVRSNILNVVAERLKALDSSTSQSTRANLTKIGISRRLGDLNVEFGRIQQAYLLYQQCLDGLLKLHATGKLEQYGVRHNLSTAYENLANSARRLGRLTEARQHAEKALEQRREWAKEKPGNEDVRQNVAATLGQLGMLAQEQGDMESAHRLLSESEQMRRQYVELRPGELEPQTQWIGARRALAKHGFQQGDHDRAIQQIKDLIAEQSELADQFPYDISYRANLALFRADLGTFHLYVDRPQDAITEYQSAIQIIRKLIQEDPENFSLKVRLADSLYGLAVAQSVADFGNDASKTLRECLEIRAAAKELDPTNLTREISWLLTAARAGNLIDTVPLASNVKTRLEADAGMYFDLAGVYGQLLAAANRGSELPEGVTAEALANESLALIKKSHDLGFRRTTDLKLDPDLAPIRSMPSDTAKVTTTK